MFFSSKEDVFFIDNCLGYFFCVKHKSLRVGDHMVYFLEVENMEFYTKDPWFGTREILRIFYENSMPISSSTIWRICSWRFSESLK